MPSSSSVAGITQVDSVGRRISVGEGSAYDLFLTREIRQAEIVRYRGAPAALTALRDGAVEAAAGVRQVLEAEERRAPGVRVLPGRFMVIQQAMGVPASGGPRAREQLAAFVEEMKASGFVAGALRRHRVEGAVVAPPA